MFNKIHSNFKKTISGSRGQIMTRSIVWGAALLLAVAGISFLISSYYFTKKLADIESKLPTPEETEPTPEPPKITTPKVLYNLAGIIKVLEENSLILSATIARLDQNNRPSYDTETKIVLITSDTKFTRLEFVTKEETKTPKETSISRRDIKVGDYVEVISNQDISEKEEFEAAKIRILPKVL